MAFDGSGNFTRLYSWANDKANSINITASRMDGEDSGFATGLSLCVTRDGQGKPASDLLPNIDNTYKLGSTSFRWSAINGGTGTFSAASGSVTIDSSTSTNAAVLYHTLAGVAKGRLGVEGTSGATVTGSSAGDLFRYSNGGNFLWSFSGAAPVLKITSSAIQGAGPTAAALVDMTPDKSTFTGTLTGMTAGTTAPSIGCGWGMSR